MKSRKIFTRTIIIVTIALSLMTSGYSAFAANPVFGPSGYDGGGFQNAVAIDPFNSGTILSGSDSAGIQRSTDYGASWKLSDTGMKTKADLSVEAIAFSKNVEGKVYLASGKGNSAEGGGFWLSTDKGASWTKQDSSLVFQGGSDGSVLPEHHPRSTGNLIAIDDANASDTYLYAGTYKDGVKRAHNNDGTSWDVIGFSPSGSNPNPPDTHYIRSIALNPNSLSHLYVALYGEGVWKTTNARATNPANVTWTKVSGSTDFIEEMKFIGGNLYAVGTNMNKDKIVPGGGVPAGKVYKLVSGSWSEIYSSADPEDWMAIDGFYDSTTGQDVIYIGGFETQGSNTIMKSTDSGSTWSSVTNTANVVPDVGGVAGQTWWLSAAEPRTTLGGWQNKVSLLAVDPSNTSRVFASGNAGIWGTTNGGGIWNPMVRRINATFNRSIVVDPNDTSKVYTNDADWSFVYSTDRMDHVLANAPQIDNGIAISLDTSSTSSIVFASVANQATNTLGEIWSNPDPTNTANTWTNEGLGAVAGGKRALGLATRPRNNKTVIIAAVEDGGIWRKAVDPTDGLYKWSNVALPSDGVMGPQSTKTASLTWPSSTNEIYLYDRETGIWRSTDSGKTWGLIWSHPSGVPGDIPDMTGYVVAVPNSPTANSTTLYVSAADGLYRLDNAQSGTVGSGITKTTLSVTNPGPIAADSSGKLYVTELIEPGTTAKLYTSTDRGATLTDISDSYYKNNAGFPLSISVDDAGYIYVALFGQGVVVGTP